MELAWKGVAESTEWYYGGKVHRGETCNFSTGSQCEKSEYLDASLV